MGDSPTTAHQEHPADGTPAKPAEASGSTLIIACGALSRELAEIVSVNRLESVTVECLPAILHNTPKQITAAVAARIERAKGRFDRILVGYADCGTGGELDRLLAEQGIERLPGAHCYEFYATTPVFHAIQDADPGTFYLTDYLVRHFERIVMSGLGLDRHPELRDDYFRNYRRVVHLAQSDDASAEAAGRVAANRLGLAYERVVVGYGDLEATVARLG